MIAQLMGAIIATFILWKLSSRDVTEVIAAGFQVNGRTVAASVAQSIESSVVSGDIASVQSALDASLRTPDVDWAYVTALDGSLIAHRFGSVVPSYLPPVASAASSIELNEPGSSNPIVMFTHPVSSRTSGALGAVHIGINQNSRFALIKRLQLLLLLTMGVVFGLLTIFVGWVTRRVTYPIRALTRATTSMTDDKNGDFQAIPVVSSNEIGELTAAFNQMMLQRQEDRKSLEGRVHTRTQDLVRANGELEKAIRKAQLATQVKSDFLSTMSHEIRTPMNGVLGMTNLLLETDLSSEQLDYALIVRASGESLLSIINDILDFSKIEAGKMAIEPIPFDLAVTIEDVVELLCRRASDKGLDLILRYSPDAPRRVIGDPGRIRQVVMNLTGNAIKFTQKGHVLINVHCENKEADTPLLHIAVEDTGIGIPAEKLNNIFDKFTQADTSTTRTHGGTGLGLAISKQLVELMDGRISVASVSGQGSKFSFTLPLKADLTEVQARPLQNDLSGARILVVDDNAINLRIVEEQLATCGGEVACVQSTAEALTVLRAAVQVGRPFHIAILDHLMPLVDGEMLGRQIKADAKLSSLLLMMLTSSAQKSDAARFLAAGFSAYLIKPARASLLKEALMTLWSAIVDGRPLDGMLTRYSLAEASFQRKAEEPNQVNKTTGLRSSLTPLSARVLVAEDNQINQVLARRLLEKAGCQVDVASNGLEAIELWEQHAYRLILMDCQMPEMDGFEATAEIRYRELASRSRQHTPIVALTANTMAGDREKCLKAGMDDFIPKPIPRDAMNRVLHRWTDSEQPSLPQLVASQPQDGHSV